MLKGKAESKPQSKAVESHSVLAEKAWLDGPVFVTIIVYAALWPWFTTLLCSATTERKGAQDALTAGASKTAAITRKQSEVNLMASTKVRSGGVFKSNQSEKKSYGPSFYFGRNQAVAVA